MLDDIWSELDMEEAPPVDMLVAFFEARGWAVNHVSDEEISVSIKGNWTSYQLRAVWRNEDHVLQLLLLPQLHVPDDKKSAIYETLFVDSGILDAANNNVSTALFELLTRYPLADVTARLAVFLIFVFFVTSADSGALVIDIITSGGNINPPVAQRIFWAVLAGVVAAVLTIGGGLTALQTAAITTGLPFALVLVLMAWCLLKALREELPPLTCAAVRELHRREPEE